MIILYEDVLHQNRGECMESVSFSFDKNIDRLDNIFKNCDDVIKREFSTPGSDKRAVAYFVETAVDKVTLENLYLGVTDNKQVYTIEDAVSAVMIGDAVIVCDGKKEFTQVKSKGYPGRGVDEAENEQTMRGSREAFSDSEKSNTALIRKRIRTPELKVVESKIGDYSNTNIAIVYVEGMARKQVVEEIKQKIKGIKGNVDSVMDSGVVEQLIEKRTFSPFPQYQVTERPDIAAMAVMEGRIAVIVDNSPEALILPVNVASFFKTADDYYRRFEIASFTRIIRYVSAFLAMALPAVYLAVIRYHSELLPTQLVLAFAQARNGVPFSPFVEVIIMELAFELIREAGVRVPGPMGSTIGIVGGLIVGQAAVDANLVSPIIVIVVALTALCSFAVPSEEFAAAFRIIKYLLVILSALWGLYGVMLGMFVVLIHLAGMECYGFPYLAPQASGSKEDKKDFIIRYPTKHLKRRGMFFRR